MAALNSELLLMDLTLLQIIIVPNTRVSILGENDTLCISASARELKARKRPCWFKALVSLYQKAPSLHYFIM